MTRLSLIIVISLLLQSCGLTDRFFNSDDCEDGSCDAPALLDNTNSEQKWFCYGKEQDEPWNCQNSRDNQQIVAVTPKPQDPLPSPRIEPPPPVIQTLPVPQASVRVPTAASADQVLEAPADHYAVQLIALRELAGVKEYASLNGITEPLFVQIRNDESDWYILLLGIYPDRTLAEAAKREWETAKVLRVQPWVRQLGGLQDAIRLAMNP